MKWSEVAWWEEVDRGDALDSFLSIHLFFGHITYTRFYEEIWTTTEKVFSQVNLFIDALKFMLEKNKFFKLLEVDVVFS